MTVMGHLCFLGLLWTVLQIMSLEIGRAKVRKMRKPGAERRVRVRGQRLPCSQMLTSKIGWCSSPEGSALVTQQTRNRVPTILTFLITVDDLLGRLKQELSGLCQLQLPVVAVYITAVQKQQFFILGSVKIFLIIYLQSGSVLKLCVEKKINKTNLWEFSLRTKKIVP